MQSLVYCQTAIETLLRMHLNRFDKLPKQVVIREDMLGYTLVGGKESHFPCIDIDSPHYKIDD